MTTITTREELRNAIAQLELQQAAQSLALKQELTTAYQSISTASILKTVVSQFVSPPSIAQTLLHTAATMAVGYFSRKQNMGRTGGIFSSVLGSVIEHGLDDAIARNADTIKNVGKNLFQTLFNRNK